MEGLKGALRIGWIGTGVMGKNMALHLQKKGYQLNVFNRTQSKADELISGGAKFMTPTEVAKNSDIVFTMLGYPSDVEKVILDEKEGILNSMKKGSVLVDHTTSSPDLAMKIFNQA